MDKSGDEINKFVEIENYFGFPESISKKNLIEIGKKQARRFGAEIVKSQALKISEKDEKYRVNTPEKNYIGDGIILASGIKYQKPDLEGLDKYKGRGVSYCSTCDGPLFRDSRVGVLGAGDFAVREALNLLEYTSDVRIFTNGKDLEAKDQLIEAVSDEGVSILKDEIFEIMGDDSFQGLKTDSGKISLDGLFVAVGVGGCVDFGRELGIPVEGDAVKTEENLSSGIQRVYAAGDCTGEPRQISTAVGEGAKAAIHLMDDLRNKE